VHPCAILSVLIFWVAIRIEYWNALSALIGHINILLGVHYDRVRSAELARRCPPGAPRLDERAVLVELSDPGIPGAIRHEDISGSIPGHVGGPIEIISG